MILHPLQIIISSIIYHFIIHQSFLKSLVTQAYSTTNSHNFFMNYLRLTNYYLSSEYLRDHLSFTWIMLYLIHPHLNYFKKNYSQKNNLFMFQYWIRLNQTNYENFSPLLVYSVHGLKNSLVEFLVTSQEYYFM